MQVPLQEVVGRLMVGGEVGAAPQVEDVGVEPVHAVLHPLVTEAQQLLHGEAGEGGEELVEAQDGGLAGGAVEGTDRGRWPGPARHPEALVSD